jgi:uncharacterized protein
MSSLLQPEIIKSKFTITGYGYDFIEVNKIQYDTSCIVSTSIEPILWSPYDIKHISKQNLEDLLTYQPDVIILGTGRSQHFLPIELQTLQKKQDFSAATFLNQEPNFSANLISIECMSTDAACRTFNILAAEGRSVTTALIIEKKG